MTTFTTTNSSFYSDQVDLRDDGIHHGEDEIIGLLVVNGITMPAMQYAKELIKHANAITKLVEEHPEVKDPRVAWDLWPGLYKEDSTIQVKVLGTTAWAAEKIAEYEEATKSEHDDVKTLRALVAKYPGKAAEALGYLLEEKKAT